ncbi:hypothetical protein IAQ61_002132 [Plenodomus lingam]|uniref:Apple domain-containing protein n=1 Tax=Leptosphaeria maculans (strain JN3 / isolate v23.1.3 / race Av1-4-5-6-7-8) TaxID=985895 RepID=E4ZH71_LEPMJ|nr:hypothetical protein LEMA_P056750.1 [Plenodomus lingam JN3]KAH9876772.1 hypothetical protein IAQ61_002132 [Plenodomus lingam]CBX90641.1 hypothetical protein LEMA_P056750.1 [Plenodomus lingam JN3]
MLSPTVIFGIALIAVASAFPQPNAGTIAARAGGPAIVPVPSSCSVNSPLPTPADSSYLPAPATDGDILYSAFYPSYTTNKTEMAENCLFQCYGYGNHTECKTAYWAENVPTPSGYYGTPGGDLSTACIFFTRPLSASDFVVAPVGQATDAYAGNIAC